MSDDLRRRARAIRFVLTDCDGVLTDGTAYYSAQGEHLKRFSLRDGMGVELLRRVGIETAIVTREESDIVAARANKLKMPFLYLGIRDKRRELRRILQEVRATQAEIGYIGDDVNDLGIIELVREAGLTAAPADAVAQVASAVHYRCMSRGGRGAFREFADWILDLRGSNEASPK